MQYIYLWSLDISVVRHVNYGDVYLETAIRGREEELGLEIFEYYSIPTLNTNSL